MSATVCSKTGKAPLDRAEAQRQAAYWNRRWRTPELEDAKALEWIGRFIGRIHAVGAMQPFKLREALTPKSFGQEPRAFLLASGLVPPDLLDAWKAVTAQALAGVAHCYERAGAVRAIRLHGDCHIGNILWTDAGPHFVDLDDARTGPAMQDLWMLLSGDRAAMGAQMVLVAHDKEPRPAASGLTEAPA